MTELGFKPGIVWIESRNSFYHTYIIVLENEEAGLVIVIAPTFFFLPCVSWTDRKT